MEKGILQGEVRCLFQRVLYDFKPVYEGILMAKDVKPERAVVEVIDEEQEGAGMFEPAGALEVLEQIGDDVNTLTIYTDRAAYFREFAETMYEKNGLVSLIVSKSALDWQKNGGVQQYFPV